MNIINGVISAISNRQDGSMMQNHMPMEQNITHFLEKYQVSPSSLKMMCQVHSATVAYVDEKSDNLLDNTDALITDKGGVFLGVITADCLPVLLADTQSAVLGALHAGYRGLLHGIIDQWMQAAQVRGTQPEHLKVMIGPSIHVCCYDVDEERAQQFVDRYGPTVINRKNKKIYVDLQEAGKRALLAQGVKEEYITISPNCTKCNNSTYFSYRGDSTKTFGQMLSIIGRKS